MASTNINNTTINNNPSLVSSSPAANEDDYLPNMAAIQGVDSEDVEDEVQNGGNNGDTLFQQLLHRMHPSTCLMPMVESISVMTYKSCVADKREEFEWRLPSMLHEIRNVGKPRTPALQKFYRLVDREHQENRVVAIVSSKETITVLILCLQLNCNANERRTALLILNNLCIPMENKVAIIHGEDFANLMSALLRLIQARTPTAYLAIVTLVNLSNIHDAAAKRLLFQFVPPNTSDDGVPPDTYRLKSALDEPASCIRTMESILRDTIQHRNAKNSVEQQCCRWAMNVIRNLVACSSTTEQENGFAVAKHTIIPELAVACLLDPHQEYAKWTRDSLPDAALMVIVHLAKDDDCIDHWRKNQYLAKQIMQACDMIMANATGIHATRASAIKEQFLENVNDRSVGYSV